MIPVTKPFFPPIEEYQQMIAGIWQREWITNHGPLVTQLEQQLQEVLHTHPMLFVSNGTIALQIAIKALQLTGQIITTPYSYVATTSSIVWEGCTPVFVDADADTFNINHNLIEQAITPATSAILATHVYGNPCNVNAIEAIAKKHHLKVIYDAAHAFGVTVNGKSIFSYGDISTSSFHGTKLFHTAEGGGLFTNDPALFKKMSLLRNFGHTSPISFDGIGINGKNSELHAAVGLCNLKYLPEILEKRKQQSLYYNEQLKELNAVRQLIDKDCVYNYAYYPLVLQSEERVLKTMALLQQNQIFTRRYYCPSLSTLNYVTHQYCPVAESMAGRVLCLPLYHTLLASQQDLVCKLVLQAQKM
jgi:dTDP-4-amino-4,6-dideoxygalactose transaminase